MKNVIIASFAIAASSLSAQEFVAGFDFDGVGAADTSITANWGALNGTATASWNHSLADFITVFSNGFTVGPSANSPVVGDDFSFLAGGVDTITGFDQFSDNVSQGEFGFNAAEANTFTISFDATGWEGLTLQYALNATEIVTVDLSGQDQLANATYSFTTAAGSNYDNFAITGTANVIPEPSTYAAIAGVLALGLVAYRRRK